MTETKDHEIQLKMESVIGDLTQRAYRGDVQGLAIATVNDKGFQVAILNFDGQAGPLLAAVTLLQHDLIRSFRYHEEAPSDDEDDPA